MRPGAHGLCAALALLVAGTAHGAVFVVNSTGDAADITPGNGVCATGGTNSQGATECTLRAAISESNAAPGVDTINFNMPATEAGYVAGPNYWSIQPGAQLPLVSTTMTIDGSSQTGYGSTPLVEINGASAGAFSDGLRISGDNVVVRALAINRFLADGIEVASGASGTVIAGCHIGLDPAGLIDRGNQQRGIDLGSGSGPSTVGGLLAADRNVISGNGNDGIIVWQSNGNQILNNYVGTDVTGNAPIGNGADGIALGSTGNANVIGAPGAGNVLSGNVNDGLELDNALTGHIVQGNIIGLGADGTTIVANGRHGLVLYDGVSTTQIGGTAAGEGNVISGNTEHGIIIDGNGNASTANNVIEGNLIGTDSTGTVDRGNLLRGIHVFGGANNTTIGGTAVGARNVISGNDEEGIMFLGVGTSDNTVVGNFIGTDVSGTADLGNTLSGVRFNTGSSSNTIGGTTAAERNVISGNNYAGVRFSGASPGGNVVAGNYIGTDLNGAGALGSSFGIAIDNSAAGNLIGGTTAGAANLIANHVRGVNIAGGAGSPIVNTVIGNRIYANSGRGIDIQPAGVNPNDAGDTDTGPNGLLNYPVITSATANGGTVTVDFDLDVPAGSYRVEFFTNPSGADPSGNGEGEAFADATTISHTGSGSESFSHAIPGAAGDVLTATATEEFAGPAYASTSEFSAAFTAVAGDPSIVVVNATGDASDATPGDGVCNTGGTNSQGATECTLRAAIQEANASPVVDRIHFSVPNTEPGYNGVGDFWSIQPSGSLPMTLTASVTLDAYTQPGAQDNTVATPGVSDAVLKIEVNGGLAGGSNFLAVSGDNSDLRGLVINGFNVGVTVQGDGNTLRGCYLGTNVTGMAASANNIAVYLSGGAETNIVGGVSPGDRNVISGNVNYGVYVRDAGTDNNRILGNYLGLSAAGDAAVGNGNGVRLELGASGNEVGGVAAGEGNVISGNTNSGLVLRHAATSANLVRGNLIGTDPAGTGAIGNGGSGLYIDAGTGNTVGGTNAAARNVISGNQYGIQVFGSASGNIVQGNYVGTDATGAAALANSFNGILLFAGANNNTIGGSAVGAGNVASGNLHSGIYVADASTTGNAIQGNYVGTDTSGTAPLPNGIYGIHLRAGAYDNRVGGLLPAEANVSAYNTGAGVRLDADAGAGNTILGNRIHANGDIGIDLGAVGVTANDALDGDSGANDLLNFPVITAATENGGNVTADFALDVPAGTYRIEFFTNPSGADPSGNGEGEVLASAVNFTHPGGAAQAFSHVFSGALGDVITATTTLCTDGATCAAYGSTSEFGNAATVVASAADLTLAKTDTPDPAPENGPLLYTLLVTNDGPSTATGVSLVDTLPAGVVLVSATPSQGSCSGVAVVTCSLGAIANGGTASVEILVTTTTTGAISNSATVSANEPDPVPANNTAVANTSVVAGGTTDIPLTQYTRLHGFLDYTVTGGSLRAQANGVDPCALNPTSAQNLSGIPAGATVRAAYLYWAGSGSAIDANVTLDAAGLAADRTWTSRFVLGVNNYDFFGGFKDVTAQVDAKRNGLYSFGGLSVNSGGIYCSASAVIAGWSLIVVFEEAGLSGKTLVLYDGFDITRNGSTDYLLSGIYAAGPPEAKTSMLLWEGDDSLGGATEQLLFNGAAQTDGLNPVNNVYNSSINSAGDSSAWGVDLDTFDVSGLVSVGDTLATTQVDTGPDLVILNAVVLQVKANVIVGKVFEDVNYGGGAGRSLVAAEAAAPAFVVRRPGATVELYDAGGTLIRTTITDAAGEYGFAGLADGNYTVRVVNDTVTSSRPGATGSEWPVQTYRSDASGGSTVGVATEVGGADPAGQDDPANGGGSNLAAIDAQSLAPVAISAAVTKSDVDFGFNFDTVVNTNDAGQGSLRAFIDNSNALGNANLDQAGQAAGVETSLFMIPSAADPQGRPQDPNFDAGRGVAVIAPSSMLPAVTDAATAIDGGTQTAAVGDTNAGLLGNGGTVGVDAVALPQVQAPEIELLGTTSLVAGLRLQAQDSEVRGLALLRFGDEGGESSVIVSGSFTGTLIEDNVFGSRADTFSDPGATRGYAGIDVVDADGGTIRRNVFGYHVKQALALDSGADGWTVESNELRDNGIGSTDGDGIALIGVDSTGVVGNLIVGSPSQGLVATGTAGATLTNNTFTGNGVGTAGGVQQSAAITMRPGTTGTTLDRNVVQANYGAGIQVNNGASGTTLTRNTFLGNGSIVARDASPPTGQIGIDLNAPGDDINLGTPPYVTPNDAGDADGGGNGLLNYPVAASATAGAGTTTVVGALNSAASTSFTLEFFSTAAGAGNAEAYLGSDTVVTDVSGNAAFSTALPVPVAVGDAITITSTDPAGNTSELSAPIVVGTDLEIVKRAFFADGTPIPSGAMLPNGVVFYYLLYVNNPGGARLDVSLRDVLDAAFVYQAGSIRIDNSVTDCAAAACTPAEEAAVFTAALAGTAMSDTVDGDAASYSGGTTTVDAGNQNAANTQLDLAANRVFALVFAVRM